jgi:tripeptide aminopeptidase
MLFAEFLRDELESIGLNDVELDSNGYLYATLPSNMDRQVPTVGFIAHMDTSPDCSGKDVRPRIIENYDGTDIILSEGIVTSPSKFPELLMHIGEDIIVTDGHTLLGADDKAGIAEIVQAMVYLMEEGHDIRVPYRGYLDTLAEGYRRFGFNPYQLELAMKEAKEAMR